MRQHDRILVAGGDTMLGAALRRVLVQAGYERVVHEADPSVLRDGTAVRRFLDGLRPSFVFAVAGRTGGIAANQRMGADLMVDNLLAGSQLVSACFDIAVQKLLYVGSSCCYPRDCAQPMRVESLMTGPLERTNEAYAMAKLAGLTLCQAYRQQYGARFITTIPANPFGPGDDFSEDGHVIPAMMRRMHDARLRGDTTVTVWGTGRPRREFIYVDDLADACVFLMQNYEGSTPINAGSNHSLTIRELATAVARTVGFQGEIRFDDTQPDGMPVKTLDSGELAGLGWTPRYAFEDALSATYAAFSEDVRVVRWIPA